MIETALSPFTGWENFYVIVGSSAAALTGLQFVVIALLAEASIKSNSSTVGAFGTPTVVHFCLALLISATLSAPWREVTSAALAVGLTGLGGLIYAAIVIGRARRQKGYSPVFEDWLWHTILPVLAYATTSGAAIALPSHAANALFPIGAAALLLVFIGIHNSWDTVTFIALQRNAESHAGSSAEAAATEEGAEPR